MSNVQYGQADAAAGILEAVGGIVTGVGDVVYLARMTESKVFTNVADYQDKFDTNITELMKLKELCHRISVGQINLFKLKTAGSQLPIFSEPLSLIVIQSPCCRSLAICRMLTGSPVDGLRGSK